MKSAPISKEHEWGWLLLSCLLLIPEHSLAQFVQISFQIEETSWPRIASEERAKQQRIYEGRCIFGTNLWMIEGEFTRNSKETWWCTGTNLIRHTVITREQTLPTFPTPATQAFPFPASEKRRNWGDVPHVGERSTRTYDSAAKRPLFGIAHISWLAFCSGSFLKSEGRRIHLPFPTQVKEGDCSDKTKLFTDELGLPERVDLYRHDTDLVFTYAVGRSTNFAGWTIPVQFEVTQYDKLWRGSATVTSIHKATKPLVPPEVMEQLGRRRSE